MKIKLITIYKLANKHSAWTSRAHLGYDVTVLAMRRRCKTHDAYIEFVEAYMLGTRTRAWTHKRNTHRYEEVDHLFNIKMEQDSSIPLSKARPILKAIMATKTTTQASKPNQ